LDGTPTYWSRMLCCATYQKRRMLHTMTMLNIKVGSVNLLE
jgi:hypothetical protein